jgi:hypothetical protein
MKSRFKIGLTILALVLVVLGAFRAGQLAKARQVSLESWTEYTSQIPPGVALNPVPLKVEGRNAAMVIRGSYLVNGSRHCNFCHTCPPYTAAPESAPPYLTPTVNAVNYMAGGKRFGAAKDTNAPVSANLTPEPKTGLPGGMTFEEFRTALRIGQAHKTRLKLESMPWPMFQDLNESDLLAIYEFLSAIPHAEPGPDGIGNWAPQ